MELTSDYVLVSLMEIAEATKDKNPNAALRAYELLGKHLGLYRDRQEISGPDGQSIKYEQEVKENVDEFTSRIAGLAKRSEVPGGASSGSSRDGAGEVSFLPKRSGEG